jgi:hypothetical protein
MMPNEEIAGRSEGMAWFNENNVLVVVVMEQQTSADARIVTSLQIQTFKLLKAWAVCERVASPPTNPQPPYSSSFKAVILTLNLNLFLQS